MLLLPMGLVAGLAVSRFALLTVEGRPTSVGIHLATAVVSTDVSVAAIAVGGTAAVLPTPLGIHSRSFVFPIEGFCMRHQDVLGTFEAIVAHLAIIQLDSDG